jgi:Tol biopolymer transport system component
MNHSLLVPAASVGVRALVLVAFLPGIALAQEARLNEPLVHSRPGGPVVGDVAAFQLAAGAGRVVYRADEEADEVFELFAATLDLTSPRVRLSGDLAATGRVRAEFAVSPDGQQVAFEHLRFGESVGDLYVAATRGGAPRRLDGTARILPPFAFTPTGERLVYRREGASGYPELCSVAVDGSAPPSVLPSPSVGWVEDFQLTADGTLAVYRADYASPGGYELYIAPLTGGSLPLRLDGDSPGVFEYRIAPDGANVVYLDGNLFSAAIDATRPPERLNKVLPPGGRVHEFAITSDSRTVVFSAAASQPRLRLYSAPIEGRRPPRGIPPGTRITDPISLTPMGGTHEVLLGFVLSADGADVLYRADARVDGLPELFRVPVNGSSSPLPLNPPIGWVTGFALAPDQRSVVYAVEPFASDAHELFSVPLAGGPSIRLETALPEPYGAPEFFQIAPDSSSVVYLAQRLLDGERELFSVPLRAGVSTRRLHAALLPGRSVLYDFVALGGGRALFRGDLGADEALELFEGFSGHARPTPR